MKHLIRKICIALIIVLLFQISLFGQTPMLKPVEAATSGPIITSKSPADDFTSVPLNSTLSITFDEVVKIGTSSAALTIYKESSNDIFESIPVNSSNVDIIGGVVTITPSKPFENNTEYYVLIDAGSFYNVSNGASFNGFSNAAEWNFKTIASTGAVPTGTISIKNGEPYTNSKNVSLNITASTPNNDSIEISFSNDALTWSSWETLSSTRSWTLNVGDGIKTVYMKLKDSIGGESQVYSDTITLDTIPPNVNGVIDSVSYNSDVTITFNEGTATLNGAAFVSGTQVTLEGTYTLLVTDAAFNVTVVGFAIDKTAPIVHGVEQGKVYNSGRTIIFNEGTATLNGAAFTSGTPVMQDGTYTLIVTDIAGNVTTVTFTIDKTAPTGSISISNGALTTTTPSVTLNLTGVDISPIQMQFSNDGVTWSTAEPFTNTKVWTVESSLGTKTVYYRLTDSAGYTSAVYTATIELIAPLNTNADLKNIAFSKGALSPVFAPNVFAYTMNVASQIDSIDVHPTADFNKATTKVNGISGNKTVPLNYGANTITIEVTAEDGITKKTYTVTVNRAKPSNPGPSNPEPINPVPVQPENPTPVKAIPNTVLPNPHGLPVATLTVNEDVKLYRLDDAGNLVEVRLAEKGSSLFVYDIYNGLYKLADNLYAIPSPSLSIHIGKGEVRKDEVNVYDKDGRFIRTIKKGQQYKVYSYDDNRYAIGGGEFIEVQDGVTYVFGWITLTEQLILYKPDGTVERVLKAGERYRIYQADKDNLHLGGAFTVMRENSMYTFVKN